MIFTNHRRTALRQELAPALPYRAIGFYRARIEIWLRNPFWLFWTMASAARHRRLGALGGRGVSERTLPESNEVVEVVNPLSTGMVPSTPSNRRWTISHPSAPGGRARGPTRCRASPRRVARSKRSSGMTIDQIAQTIGRLSRSPSAERSPIAWGVMRPASGDDHVCSDGLQGCGTEPSSRRDALATCIRRFQCEVHLSSLRCDPPLRPASAAARQSTRALRSHR